MEDKVGLTLACLNIKKLVKWIANILFYFSLIQIFGEISDEENIFEKIKRQTPKMTLVQVMRGPNGLLNGGTEIMEKNQSKMVISL